jgi:pyrrolysyl-tRNA synthetase-like protein
VPFLSEVQAMNKIRWTDIQCKRLKELSADPEAMGTLFDTHEERNRFYQTLEKKLVKQEKSRLSEFLIHQRQTKLYKLECRLTEVLNQEGFSRVTTPTIISKTQLAKMSIDEGHPLFDKVYWINAKQCLRPMLAPNLYRVMYELARLGKKPIRFFEIGPCFRKESDSAHHNPEFTMLNLVEMGLAPDKRHERLRELGQLIADTAGLKDVGFAKETSQVYGDTIDIVCSGTKLEIASGAMGPHPLDSAWRITDTWVGWGFGLERMVMATEGGDSIGKWGKSLAYLNGIRLNF